MTQTYPPRYSIPLQSGTTFEQPPERSELINLDSPATAVMTDFRTVRPVTVAPEVSIDTALENMKRAGVRLLLVTDGDERIVGVISAKDIQGERPIKLIEQSRLQRADITVAMIMTGEKDVTVLDLKSVTDSRVGHIVETLRQLERQHVLVVSTDAEGRQCVRGLFSTSQISKDIGRELAGDVGAAHSLADMVHQIGQPDSGPGG